MKFFVIGITGFQSGFIHPQGNGNLDVVKNAP